MEDLEDIYVPSAVYFQIDEPIIMYREMFNKDEYDDVEKAVEATIDSIGSFFEGVAETSDEVDESSVTKYDNGDNVEVKCFMHINEDADIMKIGGSAVLGEIITIMAVKSPAILKDSLLNGAKMVESSVEYKFLNELEQMTGGKIDE